MTRNLIAVVAAAALLGMGGGKVETLDETDAKHRGELEAQHRRHVERAKARQQASIAEERRKSDDFNKLRAEIDPTNGNSLSRQQRRFLARRNFPFLDASAGEAGTAETTKIGSVHEHAVPNGETPR